MKLFYFYVYLPIRRVTFMLTCELDRNQWFVGLKSGNAMDDDWLNRWLSSSRGAVKSTLDYDSL